MDVGKTTMKNEEIAEFYRLNDLESILEKCEEDISDRIAELKIKEADDYKNYLLYAIGKSLVSIREIITLCCSGFPDGELSLARNVYEQFMVTLYFEKYKGKSLLKTLLHKYNEDYLYQWADCLKYEAQYLSKKTDEEDEYQNILDEIKKQFNFDRYNELQKRLRSVREFPQMSVVSRYVLQRIIR